MKITAEQFLELLKIKAISLVPFDRERHTFKDEKIISSDNVLGFLLTNPSSVPNDWKVDPKRISTESITIIFAGNPFWYSGHYGFFVEIPGGKYYRTLEIDLKTGTLNERSLQMGFDWCGYVPTLSSQVNSNSIAHVMATAHLYYPGCGGD